MAEVPVEHAVAIEKRGGLFEPSGDFPLRRGVSRRHADIDEEAVEHLAGNLPAPRQFRQHVHLQRSLALHPVESLAAQEVNAPIDEAFAGRLGASIVEIDNAFAAEFRHPVARAVLGAAKRHGHERVGMARPGKPAEGQKRDIEPGIAVDQQDVFIENATGGKQGTGSAERLGFDDDLDGKVETLHRRRMLSELSNLRALEAREQGDALEIPDGRSRRAEFRGRAGRQPGEAASACAR